MCNKCSISQWVYESVESEERERPVCRCNDCLNAIRKSEEDLTTAIKTLDYHVVDKALGVIVRSNIDIDAKLKHQAEVMHLKLEK